MKKILFIASTILILLSGCENFLDSELLTEKTTANFPETEKDAQEMVTAIYAHLLIHLPASGTVATPLSTVPTMPSTQWRM